MLASTCKWKSLICWQLAEGDGDGNMLCVCECVSCVQHGGYKQSQTRNPMILHITSVVDHGVESIW